MTGAGMTGGADPEERTRQLAAESLATDDPTGWFERLYAAAESGEATVPWDRGTPHQMLVEWADRCLASGEGRSALVVGCGLGRDAEFIAGLGFDTVAFDISPAAVRQAQERHPGSRVSYVVADLLDPPDDWRHAYDLVVESLTVQALPRSLRRQAIEGVGQLVAPAGTLLVLSGAAEDEDGSGPPWPLTRAEIEAFAAGGLATVRVEDVEDDTRPEVRRWRGEFSR